jgi:hypothetical protein
MMGNRVRLETGDQAMRTSITGLAVLALAVVGVAGPAPAQDDPARPRIVRRAPLRIEVEPTRRLVRECVDRFVIEQRYAGPTIVPRTQCRWALR